MRIARYFVVALIVMSSKVVLAQSASFESLTDTFDGRGNVHSIAMSGVLCRTVLWVAGEWEFKRAISDVKRIRVITIPKENFDHQDLSLAGYRKFVKADHFEKLMDLRDHGDQVEVYFQQGGNRKDRYLVLVEEPSQVTVIELTGKIDLNKLPKMDQQLSYEKR